MKTAIAILAALGLLLVLVPGAMAQSDPASNLAGTQWQLASYGTPGAETPVAAGSAVTLSFESADRLGGNGGCNSFGGEYTVQGNMLTISGIVSTLMACANAAVGQQEQVYLSALRTAYGFERLDDQLIIHYGSGQRLIFTPTGQPAPPVEPFEDRTNPVGLLASYYNAIARQEYERAYGYWETPPDPYDVFASGFADTASVQVIVQPPARYGGAAGSIYAEIPTVLIAQHFDGEQLMYAGCFVTRRSNVQQPENPPDDAWHLYSADLTQVPTDSSIPTLLAEACSGA
ncbi:MAG TPA: META domain-containing protein [Aggregatilineaceae bacterium]|nr:META domain-containing protein [Aggregatilineaceae bacterium]